jgi:hypothetical protein
MNLAPIALFAYMRPEHLATTVHSLAANPEATNTHLTVFCDAAKKPDHQPGVDAVRQFVASIVGFASVTVVERARNWGLAASIIDGVTRIVGEHGRVIVVEDDMMLSHNFLHYMNDALDLYANDENVASIHGYCYPVNGVLPETFFLRGADCWGWATWRRAWQHFRPDGSTLLAELESRGLVYEFDMDSQYGFTQMLRDQIAGRNNSWAIRWHASCFLDGRLTLYPGRSLVHNIGNDGSGTHSKHTNIYEQTLSNVPIALTRLPTIESQEGRVAFVRYFKSVRPKLPSRILRAFLWSLKARFF